MNDTKKRIQAYKAALPDLRERVIAVALLLAMSLAMVTSASFAWLTISRAPALTGVNTTVAANGNLEIALASGDGTVAPGDSKVGDSSAAQGQSVVQSNLTWGNLVNLSDESYGLANLTMRPAQLNTASLLDSPLYGAMYGGDGRITQLNSNFAYTTWVAPTENDPTGHFGVSDNVGVRAISSTKIEAIGAAAMYVNMVTTARNTNLAAANTYTALGNNNKYMPSLATMMGLYMTARMNPSNATLSNPTCAIEDIQNLRDMYSAFLEAFDREAEAIAALINLQLFLQHGDGNYTVYDKDKVYATTTAALKAEGVQITDLDQFVKDHNTIASDHVKLEGICSSGTSLAWKDSGLNDIVNNLVNVGACTIGADNTPISSIGASNAMGYLSGTQEARITNGILYRFEERTGGYISVKNLGISATVERSGITIPATVKANIQTTAPRDYNLFTNDLTYAESLNDGNYEGGVPVAQDTYGLAIDLWVRTNAENSYLTLEGNVLTKTETVRATGTDANGNEVELYTLTITATSEEDGSTVSTSIDVYQVVTEAEDGSEVVTWRKAETHAAVTEEELGESTPVAKMEELVTVIGFEGENRVWGENEDLSVDATTQGSGSCYVYYADTPEDQARSLALLEAFNVAFVDANGKMLATAEMDTQRNYAENGRITVPLVLSSSNSINLGEDYQGNITYAIMALQKNVPTRITAIVYLDGTKLTNDEVLAAADIQGQLNIQFGSSQALEPIENEDLANKERRVSASVDMTSFDFDTAATDMTTNVTVHVDGDEPSTVTAFFIRAINSTQGSREKVMTFTQNADGDWVSSHKFTAPGTYVLRTVQLDGVDYDLEAPPTVNITGFAVKSLLCQEGTNNHVKVMTAANSSTVNLNLQFATNDESKLPKKVQGRYLRDDGSAVNIDFTYNSTTGIWSGSATFLSSGEYTMQYLVLDGEYVELDSALWQTADVTLGMRVAIYTTSPNSFKYLGDQMEQNQKLLGMQVKILDDAGDEMPGLSGVKLTYGMKGSGIKKMDADLTWDGSYYVGELQNGGPGIWQFANVVVGSNTLTTATTSPTFTIMSPEPPEYYAHNTVAYQYKPNNDAVMNAQISNSAAASVQAYIIKDGEAEGEWITGTIGGELTTSDGKPANHWTFTVPKDATGYQDGNWKLTALRLWDVFAEDGTAYTEESPLEIDISDANNVTKVVNRVYVTFATDKSQDFGKDKDGNVTAQFMDSHTISGLNVDIKDFEGNVVQGVSDVQLTFTYTNGTSLAYGNYTSSQLNNATKGATIMVALNTNSGTNYAQSQNATILYAGSYITTFSFKVSGTEYKYAGNLDDPQNGTKALPANAPVFTVSSKAPEIKVVDGAGFSPQAGIQKPVNVSPLNASWTYGTDTPTLNTMQVTKKVNDYTAMALIHSAENGWNRHDFTAPKVTLNLSGVPTTGVTGAYATIDSVSQPGTITTFSFDDSTLQTKQTEVGAVKDGQVNILGSDTRAYIYPVGTQKIEKMYLTYGGMDFECTLDRAVTIYQPQYPSSVTFQIDDETFEANSGVLPTPAYGDNDNTVTLTLPTNASWYRLDTTTSETVGDYKQVGETMTEPYGYTARGVGGFLGFGTTWYYTPYDEQTKVECAPVTKTGTGTIWTVTRWQIGDKVYDAGTTIMVPAGTVISAAEIQVQSGEVTVDMYRIKTTITYIAGSESKTNPGTTLLLSKPSNPDPTYVDTFENPLAEEMEG